MSSPKVLSIACRTGKLPIEQYARQAYIFNRKGDTDFYSSFAEFPVTSQDGFCVGCLGEGHLTVSQIYGCEKHHCPLASATLALSRCFLNEVNGYVRGVFFDTPKQVIACLSNIDDCVKVHKREAAAKITRDAEHKAAKQRAEEEAAAKAIRDAEEAKANAEREAKELHEEDPAPPSSNDTWGKEYYFTYRNGYGPRFVGDDGACIACLEKGIVSVAEAHFNHRCEKCGHSVANISIRWTLTRKIPCDYLTDIGRVESEEAFARYLLACKAWRDGPHRNPKTRYLAQKEVEYEQRRIDTRNEQYAESKHQREQWAEDQREAAYEGYCANQRMHAQINADIEERRRMPTPPYGDGGGAPRAPARGLDVLMRINNSTLKY